MRKFSHRTNLTSAKISHCGTYVLTAALSNGIKLFNMSSGAQLGKIETNSTDAKFSPDTRFIVVSNQNGDINKHDLMRGKLVKQFIFDNSPVTSIDISPNSNMLVAAYLTSDIIIWDFNSGRVLRVLKKNNLSKS